MPTAETATPVRDTLGYKLDTEGKYHLDVKDDDPTSAVAEITGRDQARGDWQVRFDVWMRLSCTRDRFRLQRAPQRP